MPELPEVETIVRGLRDLITGHKINQVWVREPKLIVFPAEDEFKRQLNGREVIALNRRGKYILINLEGGKTLVVHLRMTGKLLVKPREIDVDKHTHIIFELDNGMDLRFHNVRKFGRVYLVDTGSWQEAGGLAELGPEPLSDKFTLTELKNRIKGRKMMIKSLLLNQKFIAGLGNIYTDEALFRAGISPKRRADTLSDEELERLYRAIRRVLELGIEYGGTTFSDYLDARGKQGEFQKKLLVYRQTGENCPQCGHEIIREKIGGRSSHYCPGCQD